MPNPCPGGGTPVAKPAAPLLTNVGIGAISAGLDVLTPEFIPVVSLVDLFFFSSQIDCPSGPPAMPTFTSDDYQLLTLGLLAPHAKETIQKLQDVVKIWTWWQECECSGSATPPLPTPVRTADQPGGSYVSSPQPCMQAGWTGTVPTSTLNSLADYIDVSTQFLPYTGDTPLTETGPSYGEHIYPISQISQLSFNGHNPKFPSSLYPVSVSWWVRLFDANETLVESIRGRPTTGPLEFDYQFDWPVTHQVAYGWMGIGAPDWLLSDGPTTDPGVINGRAFCGPVGGNQPDSCCPPDPSLMFGIQQLIQLSEQILNKLAPENYKYGTVHTAVTGTGTINVAGLIGVLVDITTGVPTHGQLPGQPPYEWSVGWMSLSSPDGMIDEKRITRQHQVWLSGLSPFATVLGYYVNPGFAINITELLPAN